MYFYIIGIIYSGLLGVDTLYKKYKENIKNEIDEKNLLLK